MFMPYSVIDFIDRSDRRFFDLFWDYPENGIPRRTCLRLLLLWAIRGVGTLALNSGQFSCALIDWSIGALVLLFH